MSDRADPIIVIVDDDKGVREALSSLLRATGYATKTYESGQAFLEAHETDLAGCVLLDVMMPGMDGLAVQKTLRDRGCASPVVFITAHGNVAAAVKAMKAGAFDFLEKPLEPDVVIDCVQRCVHHATIETVRDAELRRRLNLLTPREREVMDGIVAGLTSRLIGERLEISPRTVELHRARIMGKMRADNLSDLVRMAIALGCV